MTQKTLSKLAKVIILLFCLLGVAFYGVAVPFGGRELLADAPDLQYCYLPWLIFMELMVIPDYAVLVYAWKISDLIGRDKAFSSINAKRFRQVSLLALATTVYFFAGNTVFFLLNMNHPAVYLVSFVLTFIGDSIVFITQGSGFAGRKRFDDLRGDGYG